MLVDTEKLESPNHRKPWKTSELEYLCKYYETDGMSSMAYILGRTEKTIASKFSALKKNGEYEYYKNLNKYW
jgi:hypothetical protein